MAAIDKMYVSSYKDYIEFKEWCKKQPPMVDKYRNKESICEYLYNYWEEQDFKDRKSLPIFNAPYYIDAYVIRNCPLEFMQKELELHYGDSYEQIKCGKLYSKPETEKTYISGTHFRCMRFPYGKHLNKLSKGIWLVDIELPEGFYPMWYHKNTNTWDFLDEYVIASSSSSCACIKSIKGLKRYVSKWKLPIGTKLYVVGVHIGEDYEFKIIK